MKIIELVSQHNHYDHYDHHDDIMTIQQYNECGLINPDC